MNDSSRSKIIDKVERLLTRGKADARLVEDEHWVQYKRYFPAQDFLIKECFEKRQDTQLQETFSKLVPENKILRQKKSTWLKDLRSKSATVRKAAVLSIRNAVYGEQGICTALWLRHPYTTTALMKALRCEEDFKIQELLLMSISLLFGRNFADPRFYDVVAPFFDSGNKDVVWATVMATQGMKNPEKWEIILPVFRDCKNQKLMLALCRHLSSTYKRHRKELIVVLYNFFMLPKSKNPVLLGDIARSINRLLDETTIEWFTGFADIDNPKLKSEFDKIIRYQNAKPYPIVRQLY